MSGQTSSSRAQQLESQQRDFNRSRPAADDQPPDRALKAEVSKLQAAVQEERMKAETAYAALKQV